MSSQVTHIDLGDEWTAWREHAGTLLHIKEDGSRVLLDDPQTPPAWRVFHGGSRSNKSMPIDWSEERIITTFKWYRKGLTAGKSAGLKQGRSETSVAIGLLRDLGINTVMMVTQGETA